MKIVIEIDEMIYEGWRHEGKYANHNYAQRLILDGTPLPKGHGDLIDRNEINIPYDICDGDEAMCYVNEVSPIVEADKEVEE